MEKYDLIWQICICICATPVIGIFVVYLFRTILKGMELKHKKWLENKRTEEKQDDKLVKETKEKVLQCIKDQVKETVDKKFEEELADRVKRLEEQIKSKIC